MSIYRHHPPIQFPVSTCPVCDQPATGTRHGMPWCNSCDVGWQTPRQYAERRGLRPFHARQDLAERLPWHHRGRPVVVEREGGPRR